MIGQHPEAFGLPELNLFNVQQTKDLWRNVSDDIGDDNNRRQGLLRAVAEIYAGEQTRDAVVMAQHWASARENMMTGDVFVELVNKIDPLIAVEKSPAYTISVDRMKRIYEAFPDAKFIHLVRHPIPQSKSVMGLNDGIFALFVNAIDFQADKAILDPQIAWHDININILNFLDIVPAENQMRIRGELIMENPREELAGICRWLGIRDDEEAVDDMMHPEASPFACFGPVNALFGNDPNFLRGSKFRPHKPRLPAMDAELPWRDDGVRLRPEVVALAREFGYE
jgi:hypothetical protein